jgi:hypothetical protein
MARSTCPQQDRRADPLLRCTVAEVRMGEFESLAAALEGHYDTPWAKLPSRLRQLIRNRLPLLAAPPTAVAIVRNASTPDQGTWEYRNEGEASWMSIPAQISDANAVVLRTLLKLRFNPARLHPEAKHGEPGSKGDWYGTPGCLAARIWEGLGDAPGIGPQDISPSVGSTGVWSADTVRIIDTDSGPVVDAIELSASLLTASPVTSGAKRRANGIFHTIRPSRALMRKCSIDQQLCLIGSPTATGKSP